MRKLLVVDDEPAVRSLILASLADADWEVTALDSGDHALAFARRKRPDLILLDVGLPGISGRDVLEQLRADNATASIPILYLTGLEPADGPRPDGVLRKPFTPASLRGALDAWKS